MTSWTLREIILSLGGDLDADTKPISIQLEISDKETPGKKAITLRKQLINTGIPLSWKPADTAGSHVLPTLRLGSGQQTILSVHKDHRFHKKLIGRIILDVTKSNLVLQSDGSAAFQQSDSSGKVMAKFLLDQPTSALSGANEAVQKASDALSAHKSLLDKLGNVRAVVETVLKVGVAVAEIVTPAKVAMGIIQLAYDSLSESKRSDESLRDLVEAMTRILPFMKVANEHVSDSSLVSSTMKEMLQLVTEASQYIVDFTQKSTTGRAFESLYSSEARERISDLSSKLAKVTSDFDRAVIVETRDTVRVSADTQTLSALRPVGGARYDPERGCLEGTRKLVLRDTHSWVSDDSTTENMMWLHGLAGIGKTSVASSLCGTLQSEQLLGACFFCKRDDPHLGDPKRVIPTIAHQLASSIPQFRPLVAEALRSEPDLVNASIRQQVDGLIITPIKKISHLTTPAKLVAVDALDENGNDGTRRALVDSLHRVASLAPWLKVLIISRRNADIEKAFFRLPMSHFLVRDLLNDVEAPADVLLFAKTRMQEIASDRGFAPDWPGESLLGLIAKRANGLFIWVQTVSWFIDQSPDPDQRLRRVLRGAPTTDAYTGLYLLYKTALEESVGEGEDVSSIFRTVMGGVLAVVTRKPLPESTLCGLLGTGLKEHVLRNQVDRLGALLYRDSEDNNAIRVHHLSFIDFITDQSPGHICPDRFHIDMKKHNLDLSTSCLRIMSKSLSFNICDLGSSEVSNTYVSDLQERITRHIPSTLQYSCRYWSSHIGDVGVKPQKLPLLYSGLERFFSDGRILLWLEVMSFIGKMHTTTLSLFRLIEYIEDPSDPVAHTAYDTYRFVLLFIDAITVSATHIYISGLVFSPKESVLAQQASKEFANTAVVTRGRSRFWSPCLQVWDGAVRSQSSAQKVALAPVQHVQTSLNGRYVVWSSGDGQIRIWDAIRNSPIGRPLQSNQQSGYLPIAVTDHHGNYLAFSAEAYGIVIWDLDLDVPACEPLLGHTSMVRVLTFSPDGRFLASSSEDGTVRIWTTEQGGTVGHPIVDPDTIVMSIAFTSDGKRMIMGGLGGILSIWSTEAGFEPPILLKRRNLKITFINFIALSPDNSQFLVQQSTGLQRFQLESAEPIGEPMIQSHRARSPSWSSNGVHLVASTAGSLGIHIWDVSTGEYVSTPLTGHTAGVGALSFLPDGRRLVSGSDDGEIRIWDVTSHVDSEQRSTHLSGDLSCVAISPDNKYIASSNNEKLPIIIVWNLETGAAVGPALQGANTWISDLTFSHDSSNVIGILYDAKIMTWEIISGRLISEWTAGTPDADWHYIAFSGNHRRAAMAVDNTIEVYCLETRQIAGPPILNPHHVLAFKLSFDGTELIAMNREDRSTIYRWDVKTGERLGPHLKLGFVGPPIDFEVVADGLWVGTSAKNLIFQPLNEEVPSSKHHLSRETEGFRAISFSRDHKYVACGEFEGTISIWELSTFNMVGKPLVGHAQAVTLIKWSEDGTRLLSASHDGTMRVWDTTPYISPNPSTQRSTTSPSIPHLDENGWLTSDSEDGTATRRLLWVPPDYRNGLRDMSILSIPETGVGRKVVLDWELYRGGTSWTDVRRR